MKDGVRHILNEIQEILHQSMLPHVHILKRYLTISLQQMQKLSTLYRIFNVTLGKCTCSQSYQKSRECNQKKTKFQKIYRWQRVQENERDILTSVAYNLQYILVQNPSDFITEHLLFWKFDLIISLTYASYIIIYLDNRNRSDSLNEVVSPHLEYAGQDET